MLGVIQQYGFNLVRFHTWCPPDAAFEAADRLGIYLQPELPAWVDDWGVETVTKPKGMGRDPDVAEFMRAEMRRLLRRLRQPPVLHHADSGQRIRRAKYALGLG